MVFSLSAGRGAKSGSHELSAAGNCLFASAISLVAREPTETEYRGVAGMTIQIKMTASGTYAQHLEHASVQKRARAWTNQGLYRTQLRVC